MKKCVKLILKKSPSQLWQTYGSKMDWVQPPPLHQQKKWLPNGKNHECLRSSYQIRAANRTGERFALTFLPCVFNTFGPPNPWKMKGLKFKAPKKYGWNNSTPKKGRKQTVGSLWYFYLSVSPSSSSSIPWRFTSSKHPGGCLVDVASKTTSRNNGRS